MSEVGKTILPPDVNLTGLAATQFGIVAWSAETRVLFRLDRAGEVEWRIHDPVWRPIAAAADSDGTFNVFDAAGPSLYSISSLGMVRSIRRLPQRRISGAVRIGGEWFVGGFSEHNTYSIARWLNGVAWDTIATIANFSESTGQVTTIYLTKSQDGMFASMSRWPFTTVHLSVDGRIQARFTPSVDDSLGDFRNWTSLPLVVGKGFLLQSFVDDRSDRRRFVLMTPSGKTLRTTLLNAPLAIIASAWSAESLIALRTLNRTELVFYEWRWLSPRR